MVWMTVFHFCFDLNQFRFIRQDFYENPFWTTQRLMIVALFLCCASLSQAVALERLQHQAQVARVQAEIARHRAGGDRTAMRQLVEHPRLRQREPAVEQAGAQEAELAGVEAAETAQRRRGRVRRGSRPARGRPLARAGPRPGRARAAPVDLRLCAPSADVRHPPAPWPRPLPARRERVDSGPYT